MKNKPILVVAGEPRSVFFEIFFKSIKRKKIKSPLILICCKNILLKEMKYFSFKKKINLLDPKKLKKIRINNDNINLIDIPYKTTSKRSSKNYDLKKYINNCFSLAFSLLKKKITYKFINGPINKSTFLDKKYLGITEYISKYFNTKKFGMLIYNEKLSVCPVTTHLPIKLVSKNITKNKVFEKIEIIHNFFISHFNKKPKIAITGLNPHCESILKNNEDKSIVEAALKKATKKNISIKGVFSADTIFLKSNRKKFDVIIGMYHDQVLAPLKTIYEYDAINITLGLPFLRVSPDHGPNQKMYRKNKSDPISLIRALTFLDNK